MTETSKTAYSDQMLVCWDCGTPLVMHADGAEKPCGHEGPMVLTRAQYLRLKGSQTPEIPQQDRR